MFDWHDEALTDAVWGKESDHLVPSPDSREVLSKKNDDSSSGVQFEGFCDFYKNENQSVVSESVPRTVGAARIDKVPGVFRNAGKNHENMAEFHWDGSFDDLDQILSNDDLIFGNENLGSTDELWTRSKDAASSFDFGELREISETFENKEEYLPDDDYDFTLGYDDHTMGGEGIYSTRQAGENPIFDSASQKQLINDIATRPQTSPHKSTGGNGYKQRNRRMIEINEVPFQKTPRVNNFKQHPRHARGSTHVPNEYASVPCRLPNGQNNTLTPQEKIEKLRKRQQMQAMLAIERQQQQQFGSDENTIHRNDVDDLRRFHRVDNFSWNEQDDSITVDDCSAEDAVLYKLQEVVAQLDVRVRLCIRDSLFRLAQNATQRHGAFEASSSSGRSFREETIGRNVGMPEVETGSNPIDRTVAHLLFHRPIESAGKRDTTDSPASGMFSGDVKAAKCSPRSVRG